MAVPKSPAERQWKRLSVRGEEGKNYALHFQACQLLHPTRGLRNLFSKICKLCPRESHRARQIKTGGRGRDPTFLRTIRPKVLWGPSRPRSHLA